MTFYALDIETKSRIPDHPEYALQPWRVKEGEAEISLICYGPKDLFDKFPVIRRCELHTNGLHSRTDAGELIYWWTWNGVFDIAFLIASGVACDKVKWLDAMSVFKWVIRSQITDPPWEGKKFSWSLANAAKHLLRDWPHYQEFFNIKKELLDDQAYWENRCCLDTEATLLIGQKCWARLTDRQRRSFLIEQEALYPSALAWVNGCHYDMAGSQKIEEEIEIEREKLVNDLLYFAGQTPPEIFVKILNSPKQLAGLMFDDWHIPWSDEYYTDKGQRGSGKPVVQFLIERHGDQFPQLFLIQKYREFKTVMDKFVKGPQKLAEYLGKDVFHHNIRLNSTYTRRCTYSSKCMHGG